MRGKYLFLTLVMTLSSGRVLADSVTFSSSIGAQVSVQGNNGVGTFTFPPDGPGQVDFSITGVQGFVSPPADFLIGILGEIEGTFSFTAPAVASPLETANVAGVGAFVIHDGMGSDFTATLVWNTITSSGNADFLNIGGVVNLTNFQYAGTNAQLKELASASEGTLKTNFTFASSGDLISLASNNCSSPCTASFGGTLETGTAPVPEPASGSLVLLGLLALVRRHRTD